MFKTDIEDFLSLSRLSDWFIENKHEVERKRVGTRERTERRSRFDGRALTIPSRLHGL